MLKHSYLIYCTTMKVKVTIHYNAYSFILYNSYCYLIAMLLITAIAN